MVKFSEKYSLSLHLVGMDTDPDPAVDPASDLSANPSCRSGAGKMMPIRPDPDQDPEHRLDRYFC
jgi:hypothetical protein